MGGPVQQLNVVMNCKNIKRTLEKWKPVQDPHERTSKGFCFQTENFPMIPL